MILINVFVAAAHLVGKKINGITMEVIADFMPPRPIFNQCCEIGRLGEVQCDLFPSATTVSNAYAGSQEVISFIPDAEGARCSSALVDLETF